MSLLIFYAAFAIVTSFLCSLLESSLLSLPIGHIEAMRQDGSWVGNLLSRMKHDINRPLAGILTLNTIANTAGATGVGVQAGLVFGDESLGVVSAAMTLLILFISEIIPKTLGATHSRRLATFTAIAVQLIVWLTFPLLILVTSLHRLLQSGDAESDVTRQELRATLRLGQRDGVLEEQEFKMLDNFFAIRSIRVKAVMTPRTVVDSLSPTLTLAEADRMQESFRFTRMPLCEKNLDEAEGYVTRQALLEACRTGATDRPVSSVMKKLLCLPELTTVYDALIKCLHHHEHIALVVDEYGGAAGIVALEDLLETLLGTEIVDEDDSVVDMRKLAAEQHEDFLQKLTRSGRLSTPSPKKSK